MTATTRTYRIVVGVDGSDASRAALTWSARQAAARHGTVQAITVWGGAPITTQRQALRVLDDEMAALHPGLTAAVTFARETIQGQPAEALAGASADADLLVVGGHTDSADQQPGSEPVSVACIRVAQCPVVVVPATQPSLSRSAVLVPADS